MLSSEGNSAHTQNQEKDLPLSSSFDFHWNSQEQRAEIFRLLEVYLSFEACLYHQILPLEVDNEILLLGMVNPQDGAALEYASRILGYVNRKVSIHTISAEKHREILSAYLNFKNSPQTDSSVVASSTSSSESGSESTTNTEDIELTQRPTLVPGFESDEIGNEETNINGTDKTTANNPSVQDIPLQQFQELEAKINDTKLEDLPILCVPNPDDLNPLGLLKTLPPKQFLAELIARVIVGGIGRLYFERLPYEGRILWSENGVLQSVLEKLPLSVFQGGLNELKRFAKLPLQTITEPKQIEREYLYQRQRLMVRIRVMPGMYGEEATLQVLRGAALKFYQQQQLARLSRNALGISQQLSYKLHELQARMVKNSNVSPEQIEALTVLNRLLHNLDSQIENFTDKNNEDKKTE